MIKVLPTFLTIFFDKARNRSFWITGRPSVTVRLCWGRAGKPLFNHWISILLSKIIHFSEFLFMRMNWNEIEFTINQRLFSSRPGHPDGACYYSDTLFINRDLATLISWLETLAANQKIIPSKDHSKILKQDKLTMVMWLSNYESEEKI